MVLGGLIMYFLGSLVVVGGLVFLIFMGFFFIYEVGVCFFQRYLFRMLLGIYILEVEVVLES